MMSWSSQAKSKSDFSAYQPGCESGWTSSTALLALERGLKDRDERNGLGLGDAPRIDEPVATAAALQKGTMLVLDDDRLALDLMVRVVASAFPGCTVAASSDVAEAMALCETEPIDCLMIDYDMPDVDGLTAARYLRTRHPVLPIILFTGVRDDSLAWEAIQAGLNGYIPKHRVSSDLLRRTVSSAIAQSRSLSSGNRLKLSPGRGPEARPGQ